MLSKNNRKTMNNRTCNKIARDGEWNGVGNTAVRNFNFNLPVRTRGSKAALYSLKLRTRTIDRMINYVRKDVRKVKSKLQDSLCASKVISAKLGNIAESNEDIVRIAKEVEETMKHNDGVRRKRYKMTGRKFSSSKRRGGTVCKYHKKQGSTRRPQKMGWGWG